MQPSTLPTTAKRPAGCCPLCGSKMKRGSRSSGVGCGCLMALLFVLAFPLAILLMILTGKRRECFWICRRCEMEFPRADMPSKWNLLIFIVLVLGMAGWGYSTVQRQSGDTGQAIILTQPVNPPPPTATHKPSSPATAKAPETKPVPTPKPIALASLEGLEFPLSAVSVEPFGLLDRAGKETPIPIGTSIKISSRSKSGTLVMMIGGQLFVGNEERLLNKIKKERPENR